MPTPRKGESEDDFVSRCIPIVLHEGTAKDEKQAAAICHSMWQKKGDAMLRQWYSMKVDAVGKDKPKEGDNGEEEDDEEDDDKENPFKKKSASISIYDEIGSSFWGEAVSAKAFIDDLTGLGELDEIELHLNSPGGDVFDGIAIHNALKTHKASVTAHVDGIAASIASYIAMAADRIVMPANSFILLHNASGFAMGTAEDMRAVADDLDRIDATITNTYAARSKQTVAKVRSLLKEDRLMDAKEAKSLGYADEVTKEIKLAANFPLRLLPKAAADRLRAETGLGVPIPEPGRRETPLPLATPASHASAEVIDLGAAKQTGIDEHRAYVGHVTDLCTLAGVPQRVGEFVREATPIDKVRAQLLEQRATTQEPVMPLHPVIAKNAPANMWEKITDKLNARHNLKGGK